MRRRDFTLLLTVTVGTQCHPRPKVDPQNAETIIVVGAGMAGLAAARELHDAGHHVMVLEGRQRLGGRVFTSREWPEAPMDLGASWIHGPRGNPLSALADAARAPRRATDSDVAPVHDTDGHELSKDVWDDVGRYRKLIQNAMKRATRRPQDTSIAEAAREEIDLAALTHDERKRYEFTLNDALEQEYALDVRDLSAQRLFDGEGFGGQDVLFPKGYGALAEHLSLGLDVRFGKHVTQISHDESGVTIHANEQTLHGDRVVVTLPIGVLKHGNVRFDPPLPETKRQAIAAMGVGVMNKLVLQFPSVFWQKDADWISYLSEPRGRFSTWLSAHRTSGYPILTAFNVAGYGRALEEQSDEEMVRRAMHTLRKMYGPGIPPPNGVQATRWHSDPWARCSYSGPIVGMPKDTRATLAAPIAHRVFFAGEATSELYPSTVHGAYLSGQREAQRILRERWL